MNKIATLLIRMFIAAGPVVTHTTPASALKVRINGLDRAKIPEGTYMYLIGFQ